MKVNKNQGNYEVFIEGSIGEGSPLFQLDVRDAVSISIDMEKLTYINSVGVKGWIQWTLRVPPKSKFNLRRVPLVIINQASMVSGFLPAQAVIENFQAPFVCPDCNTETVVPLTRGKEYEYAAGSQPKRVDLPTISCPKCKAEMEADFTVAKALAFLDKPVPA
jgi:hypothetical protein